MQTHCLFAKQARIWCSQPWQQDLSFEDNVKRSIPAFALFASAQKRIDGFAFDISSPGAGDSVQAHAGTVNHLLCTLRLFRLMCNFSYDPLIHCIAATLIRPVTDA